MNIHVLFHGLCLWWLATQPAMVLIPDFTGASVAHEASLTAPATAFAAGTCPAPFTTDGATCVLMLNGAGGPGGVGIRILGAIATNATITPTQLCALPKIQHVQPMVLAPEYTPPAGTGLSATVAVTSGVPESKTAVCMDPVPGNCPRYVDWAVPAAADGTGMLVLSNLAGGTIQLPLAPGAVLSIANQPSAAVADLRRRERKARALRTAASPTPLMDDSDAGDWCLYFQMLQIGSDASQPQCPGLPAIPPMACGPVSGARRTVASHHSRVPGGPVHEYDGVGTIACSNSQYP